MTIFNLLIFTSEKKFFMNCSKVKENKQNKIKKKSELY